MRAESSFSGRLKAARRTAGLTQEELAERSGIAVRTISDLERGVNEAPRAATARLLADALGLAGDARERFIGLRPRIGAGGTDGADGSVAATVFRRVLVPPTRLVGRDETVAQVASLLADPAVRLVTLTGPGGIGKTRLAAQVAAELLADDVADSPVDEVTDIDLAAVRDEAELLREVAGTFGNADKGTGADGVAELIGDRRLLLVLDNFEQLVEAGPVLSRVLARCPGLRILVTSRLPLRIRGEHEIAVPPLDVPGEAADLTSIAASSAALMFAACARQRQASWQLDGDTSAPVAMICRAVDGMPLAIELAASHIGTLEVSEIAERLAKSMRLLSSGPRDLPARQRTLAATIGWSYDLLDGPARTLLRRLAVFPAGFSASAAEEVGGDAVDGSTVDGSTVDGSTVDGSTVDGSGGSGADESSALPAGAVLGALATLADAGLIHRVEVPGGFRYRLYETVREYAADLLADSAETDAMTAAHAAYMLRLTEPAAEGLSGPDQVQWLDRLAPHREDIRFAMERLLAAGRQADALRLGSAVGLYWQQRGHLVEGYGLLDAALGGSVPEDLDAEGCRVWGRALTAAATLHYILGGRDLVRDRYRQAAVLWERAGHRPGVTAALINLAMYEHYNGDRQHARVVYAQALAAARESGEDRRIASALQNFSMLLIQDGDLATAEPMLEEALVLTRNVGSTYTEANIEGTRAELALAAGDLDRAERLARAAQRLFEDLGDDRGGYEIIRLFANIAAARGDDEASFGLHAQAVSGYRTATDPWGLNEALRGQARVALRLGRASQARTLAREARALAAQIGDQAGADDADEIIAAAP